MSSESRGNRFDLPELRDRVRVFRDREEAGEVLARMLETYRGTGAMVLAVPAGGIPVGMRIAERLGLAFDVAVVSKITPAWESEVGYGAVAFDGTVRLNDDLVRALRLTAEEVRQGIEHTRRKVARRMQILRGDRPMSDLAGRLAILVDDGLASGFTMRVAVEAVGAAGAGPIVVGVPTAHERSLSGLAGSVEAIYCPNVRGGLRFAVADAYERWHDLDEREVGEILDRFRARPPHGP